MYRKILIIISLLFFPGLVFSATMPANVPLGSINSGLMGPSRIAVNTAGWIYVTDPLKHRVDIYANNGQLIYVIKDIKDPLGIVCDGSGKVMIGDRHDADVKVYDRTGVYRYSIGGAELGVPIDLDTGPDGTLYVVDSKNSVVHTYDSATGKHTGSFGSGYLVKPVSIAVDTSASEIYIAQRGTINVFDMNGNYLRGINGGGGWFSSGNNPAPQGMFVDAGRLYVAESYYGAIAVYDNTGTFLGYIGDFGKGAGELRVPLDVTIDANSRMLVADYNNSRIEMYGLDNKYTQCNISPSVINLSVYENGNPVTENITISSTPAMNFTVTSDVPWLTVSPGSGVTDSTVLMTLNPSTMTEGNYTGRIKVTSGSGTESMAVVNVNVLKDYSMTVSPLTLNLTYQKGSDTEPSGIININTGGGNFSWSAASSEGWIKLDRTSGDTADGSYITVTADIEARETGTYNGTVTIDAGPGVTGSPAIVDVNLKIVKAGGIAVQTNLTAASYTIGGPATYTGTGMSRRFEDVPQGRYRIVFDHVKNYKTPSARIFYVRSGREVVVEGIYDNKASINSVAAVSGGNTADMASIVDIASNTASQFGITANNGAEIATGDYDGDGVDEIAVSDMDHTIKIYKADGTVTGQVVFEGAIRSISSADINGDGVDDIVVGMDSHKRRIIEYIYLVNGAPVRSKRVLKAGGSGDFSIACGDFNGDGRPDIAVADINSIKLYNMAGKKARKITTIPTGGVIVPQLAAGDLDDDGRYEIIVSDENAAGDNIVSILNADGSAYLPSIVNPFGDLGYTGISSVSAGDTDGDGRDEIILGAPQGDEIRIYETDGSFTGTTLNGKVGNSGVRVSGGVF